MQSLALCDCGCDCVPTVPQLFVSEPRLALHPAHSWQDTSTSAEMTQTKDRGWDTTQSWLPQHQGPLTKPSCGNPPWMALLSMEAPSLGASNEEMV